MNKDGLESLLKKVTRGNIRLTEQAQAEVESLIWQLPPKERAALKGRFGLLEGTKQKTYAEMGAQLGVSAARSGQLTAKAIRRLQYQVRSGRLRQYVEWGIKDADPRSPLKATAIAEGKVIGVSKGAPQVTEENQNTTKPNEQVVLTNRFVTAWVNFCTSVVTLRSNESSFQAWFASHLIQEFGLARVYREILFDKKQISRCFVAPKLEDLSPESHRDLHMEGHELKPDVCVSTRPYLDTRHTATRSTGVQDFIHIVKEIDIITELKVATSKEQASGTRFGYVYEDVQKLAVIMNAPRSNLGLPLFFVCVLDNQPKPQSVDFVENKFVRELLKRGKTWPTDWRRPTVLVTAPISDGSEVQWRCYLIDGATDWKSRIVAQFSGEFGTESENRVSPGSELPKPSTSKASRARMREEQLLANNGSRVRELYIGLKELAKSQPFNDSDFTKSGYTFRYYDGRKPRLLLTLCPDCVNMGFGRDYPQGFPNEKDFWSQVATISAFEDKMQMKHPEFQLDDKSWSHEDVATLLNALRQLKGQN
jgi:hypothetical protein